MRDGETVRWPDRYSRQTRFAPIGAAGQRRLAESSALVVGCGALGASLAQHMTRAGVGVVRIVDRDYVEPSNLQRQVLFDEADALAALPKAVAAASRLRSINSDVKVEAYVLDVNDDNITNLVSGIDIVLDGTDNARTRLLLSDVCFEKGIPLVYGGVTGSQGMSAMMVPGETGCLRCIIGDEADAGEGESCDTVGVLAAAVEFVASLQTVEAIKYLSGNRETARRTWIAADLWNFSMRQFGLPNASPHCKVCGLQGEDERCKTNWSLKRRSGGEAESMVQSREAVCDAVDIGGSNECCGGDSGSGGRSDAECAKPPGSEAYRSPAVVLCGRDTVQVTLGERLNLTSMRERFALLGCEMTVNRYLLKAAVADGIKLVLFPDGRVLVQGTDDPEAALQLCERYCRQHYSKEGYDEKLARL